MQNWNPEAQSAQNQMNDIIMKVVKIYLSLNASAEAIHGSGQWSGAKRTLLDYLLKNNKIAKIQLIIVCILN